MYNLTVDGEHEYYANGVLVSNCDAARYCLAELNGMSYRTREPASAALVRAAGNRPVTAGVQSAAF